MVDYPACRLATWADVEGWIDRLAEQVEGARHRPESIVALTRGGWAPARLLTDRLGVKKLIALRTQHWGVTATPSGRAELTEGISGTVRDESVLIVDDITDTGESLELALQHITAHSPAQVESATCLHITDSKFVPTYYAETIDREQWVWVVFPWTYWEDLRTLAGRAYEANHDVEAAHRSLRERCGLVVPLEDVRRAVSGNGHPAKRP
ncbi:MAG: phosphoribosyltransferase [Thermoplasmata archaeon]